MFFILFYMSLMYYEINEIEKQTRKQTKKT